MSPAWIIFDCGVMISASHNPFYDNGIKLINSRGEKMDDQTIADIEAYLDGNLAALGLEGDVPVAKREELGEIVDYVSGRNRYVGYLISLAAHSYKNMRVGLTAPTAARGISPKLFLKRWARKPLSSTLSRTA